MNKNNVIYVAGHLGLVGSAVTKALKKQGFNNLVLKTHQELDLTDQAAVKKFFLKERPEYVFLAAATVGGIMANSVRRADFIYNNIMIASNVIHASYKSGVKKLLNLGSSCIYPKMAPQPLKENSLLTGLLESSNEPYAVAKISAIKLCQAFNHQYQTNFISAMPANLYGPNDNFDLNSSHVLPAMIRKTCDAKRNGHALHLWGDGSPMREFLYSEDLADALIFLMKHIDAPQMPEGFLNIGTGREVSVKQLFQMISDLTGYSGEIIWDTSKPNGTPRKVMDVSAMKKLGWTAPTQLDTGLELTYRWFLKHQDQL